MVCPRFLAVFSRVDGVWTRLVDGLWCTWGVSGQKTFGQAHGPAEAERFSRCLIKEMLI